MRQNLIHVQVQRNGRQEDALYVAHTPELATVGDLARRALGDRVDPGARIICETSDDRQQWARAGEDIPLQPLVDDYGHRFLRINIDEPSAMSGLVSLLGRFNPASGSKVRNRSLSPTKQQQQQCSDPEEGSPRADAAGGQHRLYGLARDVLLSVLVGSAVYLIADIILRERFGDGGDVLAPAAPESLPPPPPPAALRQLPAATPPPFAPHPVAAATATAATSPAGSSGCPADRPGDADPLALRLRGDGEWRRAFEPEGAYYMFCPAAGPLRVPPDAAKACLGGRTWIMAGDSNMRETFLALIEWVESGFAGSALPRRVQNSSNRVLQSSAWQLAAPEHPQAAKPPPDPRSPYPQDWPSWEDFFLARTRRLEGRMCCDCYRHDPGKSPSWEGAGTVAEGAREHLARENIHYANDKLGFKASFFLLHGDRGGRAAAMAHAPGCANGSAGHQTPASEYHKRAWVPPWVWEGDVITLAQTLRAAGVSADAFVLAGGSASGRPRWTWAKKAHRMRPALDAVESVLRGGTGRAAYQTTLLVCSAREALLGRAVTERHAQEELRKRRPGLWGYVDGTAMASALTAQLGGALGLSPEASCGAWRERQPAVADVFVDDKHWQPYFYFELMQQTLQGLGC
eukprot:TRINITY_DN22670_c0_g1_i1.p1 TRINITY_DN22670_c0_g1~~TRINITY_DN22670_c0_g1_i1.p1  ORF type:complete len:663 (+),score=183.99 TRINITY_DN22670_c0_g1_i1:98-1990(+)